MASGDVEQVQLRRYDTSRPWGFRLQGGVEFNMPLYIAQVSSKSIADKAGARNGDAILQICGDSTQGWSHSAAKQAMIRAGNEVDLVVQRGVVNVESAAASQAAAGGDQGSEPDEQSIDPHMNEGSKFRNVMPKSYRMLEEQLSGSGPPSVLGRKKEGAAASAPPPAQPAADSSDANPGSIFDRKKQDRSDYLHAQGQTIQKAYGQKY